jgi:hypothetical protein
MTLPLLETSSFTATWWQFDKTFFFFFVTDGSEAK